jgi:hypothetical protein
VNRKGLTMKQACQKLLVIFLVIILNFAFVGCGSTGSTKIPTQPAQLLSPTFFPATATSLPDLTVTPTNTETISPSQTVQLPSITPSPTNTPTPLDTLRPEVVEQTLQPLFREPLDCAAPCFWGMTPQKTTLDEANLFFNHLGLPFNRGIDEEKGNDYFYEYIRYESSSGLSSNISLYGYKNIVETIRIQMSVPHQDQTSRKVWSAYTPEMLIKRYGSPSRVDLVYPIGPDIYYSYLINLYFDANSMIVEYIGGDLVAPNFPYSPRICLSNAPIEGVWAWFGDNPRDPPHPGVEVEKATSLTIDQFTQLMLGDPKNACFTLNWKAFYK